MSESSASALSMTRMVRSKKMRNSSEWRICCFSSSVSSLGGAFYVKEIVREEKKGQLKHLKRNPTLERDCLSKEWEDTARSALVNIQSKLLPHSHRTFFADVFTANFTKRFHIWPAYCMEELKNIPNENRLVGSKQSVLNNVIVFRTEKKGWNNEY